MPELVCRYPINTPPESNETIRRSLHIGINEYANPRDNLGCCVADAKAMADRHERMGFITELLLDSDATKQGIEEAANKTVSKCRPGDTVVISYAGHGSRFFASGKQHETLVPHDHRTAGQIIDYTIGQSIDKLQGNGNLTLFFDSCYSSESTRSTGTISMGGPNEQYVERFLEPDEEMQAAFDAQIARGEYAERSSTHPYDGKLEILFAGCEKNQTSKESGGHGHFTRACLDVFDQYGDSLTNEQFIDAVRVAGRNRWNNQRPGLWSCRSLYGQKMYEPTQDRWTSIDAYRSSQQPKDRRRQLVVSLAELLMDWAESK